MNILKTNQVRSTHHLATKYFKCDKRLVFKIIKFMAVVSCKKQRVYVPTCDETSRDWSIWKCEGNLKKHMRKNYGLNKWDEGIGRFSTDVCRKITCRNNNIWKCEGNLRKNRRKNYGFKKGKEGNSKFPTGVCKKITSRKKNITIREGNFNSRKTNTGTYV